VTRGTTELDKVPAFLTTSDARVNEEPTWYAENAQATTQTFNKFWCRCSEAALARQRCSQSDHDTFRSRRSEARPR